jgi:hypothetical protein
MSFDLFNVVGGLVIQSIYEWTHQAEYAEKITTKDICAVSVTC